MVVLIDPAGIGGYQDADSVLPAGTERRGWSHPYRRKQPLPVHLRSIAQAGADLANELSAVRAELALGKPDTDRAGPQARSKRSKVLQVPSKICDVAAGLIRAAG